MVVGSDAVAEVARWADGIEEMHQCIAGRWNRPELRRLALAYLRGCSVRWSARRGGPPQGERNSPSAPHRRRCHARRSTALAVWDARQVRDDLRDYVMEHLGDADGVLVVDGTGFLKKGTKSVGVLRQCTVSTVGRRVE